MKKILTMLLVLLLSFATVISLASCDAIMDLFGGTNDGANTEGSSEGLQFILQEVSYMVSIGSCTAQNIVIPKTYNGLPVTDIMDFSDCDFIKSIEIPDTVIKIYPYAFNGCTNLIEQEGGVHYVDNWVVGCDKDRAEVKLRDGTVGIAHRAFENCANLQKIDMPESLIHIYDGAFLGCGSLMETVDGVNYIGNIAVSANLPSTKLTFRPATTMIASDFFGSFDEVIIPDSVKFIGTGVFFDGCERISIGSGVEYIGLYSLSGNDSLLEISVSESNKHYKSIDGNLYTKDGLALIQYCTGREATAFTVPSSVTAIDNYAFFGCYALEYVNIGSAVTHLGGFIFANCPNIKTINIPASVISIHPLSLVMCESLTEIRVDPDNAVYKSIYGNLYSKDEKTFILYAMGKEAKEFTIPHSVTHIGKYAFALCNNLEKILLGSGVTHIDEHAFSQCESLKNISLTGNVTYIGDYAFAECSSLTGLLIGDKVTSIGSRAFAMCENLASINLGDCAADISPDAFDECYAISQISLGSSNKVYTVSTEGICKKDGGAVVIRLKGSGGSGGNSGGNTGTGSDNWWDAIKYDETELRMQMTKCSNNGELIPGCEKYLAGSGAYATESRIDELIAQRNDSAYRDTKVNLEYVYCSDSYDIFGYTNTSDYIAAECMSNSSQSPDIFCNWMTDLTVCSLKGCFANLFSAQYGEGDYIGENYFALNMEGYMPDLMSSLSLSTNKWYVIASDYFMDIIRSEYVIPVNVSLFREIAGTNLYPAGTFVDINALMNEANVCSCDREICKCTDGTWTYDRLIQFSEAAYRLNGTSSTESLNSVLGFALDDTPAPARALVHSSTNIIQKWWEQDYHKYSYHYPQEYTSLSALFDKVTQMVDTDGIYFVTSEEAVDADSLTSHLAIRQKFANGSLLFGGITTLGALEDPEYRGMMTTEQGGFAILPVPKLNESCKYSTQLHVTAKMGAIRVNTEKFVQCSAFLNYQTIHSSGIVEEYYTSNFVHGDTDKNVVTANLDMLHFIRRNLRSALDATYEDVLDILYEDVNGEYYALDRYHQLLVDNGYRYNLADSGKYLIYQPMKDHRMQDIINEYDKLPS